MMNLRLALTSLVLFAPFIASGTETNTKSTATIPMEEFLELRKKTERVDLTVIEEVRWSGTFGKSLTVSFSGSSTGRPTSIEVLERGGNLNLIGCSGPAILHTADEKLSILPTAPKFKLTCQVRVRSWSQLEIPVFNAVSVDAQITGAETILETSDDAHRLTIARTAGSDSSLEKADVAAVARHRLSILPEETRFEYQFVLSNPGRNKRAFVISMPNGEIAQSVKSDCETQESGRDLKITLVPGENRVSVAGRFVGTGFKPPVERAQNFLLIENQPTLQITIESQARRIAASDAGLASRFPSSRAYLLGSAAGPSGTLKWTSRKLDAFSSLGYSVSSAEYRLYVPRQGAPIIEATLMIDNQGMPEIPLKIPGRATFVEIAGQPQVLAKDTEGRLLLQLPTGRQSVLVQYESEASAGGFVSRAFENLARPDAILSNVHLYMTLDDRWRLLVGRGLYDADSDVESGQLVLAGLVGLLLYAFLAHLGLGGRARIPTVVAAFGCAAFDPPLGYLLTFAMIVALAVRYRAEIWARRPRSTRAWVLACVGVGAGSIVLLILTALFATPNFNRAPRQSGLAMSAKLAQTMEYGELNALGSGGGRGGAIPTGASEAKPAPPPNDEPAPPAPAPAQNGEDFQGLPARVQLPTGGRNYGFSQAMIDRNANPSISATFVSSSLLGVGLYLSFAGLIGGLLVWRKRWKQALRLN